MEPLPKRTTLKLPRREVEEAQTALSGNTFYAETALTVAKFPVILHDLLYGVGVATAKRQTVNGTWRIANTKAIEGTLKQAAAEAVCCIIPTTETCVVIREVVLTA